MAIRPFNGNFSMIIYTFFPLRGLGGLPPHKHHLIFIREILRILIPSKVKAFEVFGVGDLFLGNVARHKASPSLGIENYGLERVAAPALKSHMCDFRLERLGVYHLEVLIAGQVHQSFPFLKFFIQGVGDFLTPKIIQVGLSCYSELDAHLQPIRGDKV